MNELVTNSPLVFYVNGKRISIANPDPEDLLVHFLRENLHLTGTKIGCSEGGCGACTVMISKINRETGKIHHFAAISCLTPLCAMHGAAVTTVEGIGSIKNKLHPVQERLAKAHGLQCGFCTPGIVMSMYALLRNSDEKPSMKDLEKAFQGNLCRCTGYRPIIEGYRTFTKDFSEGKFKNQCPMGEKCCKNQLGNKLFDENEFEKYENQGQEVIFPPGLKNNNDLDTEFLLFKGPRVEWYRPVTLKQLKSIKEKFPFAKIIAGNTEIGLEMQKNLKKYQILINVEHISELKSIKKSSEGLKIGANVTLSSLEAILSTEIDENPTSTRLFKAIRDMLHWFSGAQVRNVATVVGNIVTASPISDLNPILLAAGVKLEIFNPKSNKTMVVEMNSSFFTGYRKTILAENDVVLSFFLPFNNKNQHFRAYKQSKRRDDDIAIVNLAINVELKDNSKEISSVKVAKKLNFKWNNDFLEAIIAKLSNYFNENLKNDAPGGETQYRKTLVLSLFYQGFLSILKEIDGEVLPRELIDLYEGQIPQSSQLFEKPDENQAKNDPIGRPEVTISAFKCTTGEAIYTDDIPSFKNELHMALLFSEKAHAKILKINPDKALKLEGVEAFFSAENLTEEQNKYTLVLDDERVFKDNVAECNGQVLGAIVAKSRKLAQEAVKLVEVEYEELEAIVTLEEAIERESFYPNFPIKLENGDVEALENDPKIMKFEGTFRTGKQEHFYIEPQSVIVVPKIFI
ncbi:xanthine dehydrogenase-like [Culicoides brevitarsis]|uniref:xanthine dehydrogenase-like n=1 Tax=Culicoides brevitarsis TaxID=469753 RepID=UPI00307B3BA6